MLKKILQLIVILVFITQGVMAQSVEIAVVDKAPGSIQVPMSMNDFNGEHGDVAAITLYIEYDSDLLVFTGISNMNPTIGGQWLANYNSGSDQLIITWTASGLGYDIDGPLLDLDFDYKGGFSTVVSFVDASCEIANDAFEILPATYDAGSVSQMEPVAGTISMGVKELPVGNIVSMPLYIQGAGFGAVSGLTFMVAFDDTKLAFAGISENAITNVVANYNGGMLEIIWTGLAMDFTASTHLLDMEFVYYGGNADVEFSPGCEIVDDALGLLPFDYTNGTVEATVEEPTLTLNAVGGTPDQHVLVPIVASDFTSSILGAMTLNVSFDNAKLTYTGYTIQQPIGGWVISADGSGNITLLWSNINGSLLTDGDVVTLDFIYDAAGGQADLSFAPGSIVKSVNLVTIPVDFTGGSVANYEVSGKLSYNNIAARPIFNTTVYLRNLSDDNIAYTITTDVNGDFTFTGVGVGSFYLDASTTLPWGGVNMGDAIIIRNNPPTTAEPLLFLAADVNEGGSVNIGDAILIRNRINPPYNKHIAWTASDWLFEPIAVNVTTANVSIDFGGICSGDANASNTP